MVCSDDRLTETGIPYGMEITVEEAKVIKISRQPSPVQMTVDKNIWRMWHTWCNPKVPEI
jgi:hypothetical protein